MKPTFYDFRSLMKIFMPKYDEVLESKLNLPEGTRVIFDPGYYQLLHEPTNQLVCEPMLKVEFFVYLKANGYTKP